MNRNIPIPEPPNPPNRRPAIRPLRCSNDVDRCSGPPVWLAAALIHRPKAAQPPDPFNFDSNGWRDRLRDLVLFVALGHGVRAGDCGGGAGIAWLTRRAPLAQLVVWVAMLVLARSASSTPIAKHQDLRVLGTPLTYPLLHAREISPTCAPRWRHFCRYDIVAALVLSPSAYVALGAVVRAVAVETGHES